MSNDNKNNGSNGSKINGTKGDDTLIGTSGKDVIDGKKGNDVLDGRQGSDQLFGNSGNDTFIYRMSQNAGAKDVYDGGKGTDTLRLEFTNAEWLQSGVQTDIARFLDSLDDCRGGRWFEFKAFNLKVTDIENLEVWVDGVRLDARDQSVNAVNDKAAVAEGGTVTGNVIANDSVPDLVKVVALVDGPEHGTLTLDIKGNFSFAAGAYFDSLGAGQTATETFKYRVTDADGDSDTAVVTITITGTNDGPVAKADAYAAGEDTVLTVAAKGVLANDSDIDAGDVLKVSSTGATTSAKGATVKLNADGSFSYDARSAAALQSLGAGQSAADSFNYSITDGHGGSATATVTVTVAGVNDGPVARADAYATGEDTVLTVAANGVLANDSDIDVGDVLKVSSVGAITSQMGASVTLNADGSFSYDARSAAALQALNSGQSAIDSFNYTVSDGHGGSATATVKVTVAGATDVQNHAPVAADDAFVTNEDAAIKKPKADARISLGDVLDNDSDTDGDTLTVAPVSYALENRWRLEIDETGQAVLVDPVKGKAANFDSLGAGESITFTHDADGNLLSYTISDGLQSDTANVTVTVEGRNDGPEAFGYLITADEDSSFTLTRDDLGFDVDAHDTLTWSYGAAAHGQIALNADGSITFTADADYNGTDSFSYTLTDQHGASATGVVDITLNPVNDAPDALDDDFVATEAPTGGKKPVAVVLGNVLDNDSDPDADAITITPVNYVLDNGWYLTIDGTGEATLSAPAKPPKKGDFDFQALGEGESISFTQDADGHALSYEISDGLLTDTATVTVTVLGRNDAPEAFGYEFAMDEDTSYTLLLQDLGWDPDRNDALTGTFGAAANGVFADNGDGTLTYTPNENYAGDDSISYTLTDSQGASSTAVINVTVNQVNDAPDAVDDEFLANEDAASVKPKADVTLALGNVLDNDSDIEGDGLTVNAVTYTLDNGWRLEIDEAGHAQLVVGGKKGMDLNSLGEGEAISFSADSLGNALTYTISDGALTDTASLAVTVLGNNDAPEAFGASLTIEENSSVTLSTDELGWDPDRNDSLSWAYGPAANGTIADNGDGTLTYTPNENYEGEDSFSYTLTDALGTSASGTVFITLTPSTNSAPLAGDPLPHQYLTTADGYGAFDLPANAFTDPDGDTLTYSIEMANGEPAASYGLWADPQTGHIDSVANMGRHDVRLTATDPDGATASGVFSIFMLSPSAEWHGTAGNDFFGVSYVSIALLDAGAGSDTLFVEGSGGFIFGGDGNDTIFVRSAAPWLAVDAGAGADRVALIFENTKMGASVDLGNDSDHDTIEWHTTGPWPDGTEVVELSNFRLGPNGDLMDFRGLLIGFDGSSDIEDFVSLTAIDPTIPPGPPFQADLAFSVDLDGPGSEYAFQQFAILRDVILFQPDFSNQYVDQMVPYNLAV